jgi:hypothetical protein
MQIWTYIVTMPHEHKQEHAFNTTLKHVNKNRLKDHSLRWIKTERIGISLCIPGENNIRSMVPETK